MNYSERVVETTNACGLLPTFIYNFPHIYSTKKTKVCWHKVIQS